MGKWPARNDSLLAVAEAYFNVQQARGELAGAVDAARRAEEVVRRTGKFAGGGRVDPTRWQGGAMTPPQKLGPPSGHPGFSSLGAAHVHRTLHFSSSFLRSRYA